VGPSPPNPPIVFKTPGHKPDVHLNVSDDLEFHVHSVVLKLRSASFCKFLDSTDQEGAVSNTTSEYEWSTKIDDDGTWGLVMAASTRVSVKDAEKIY
jgi:hypothetical protein